MNNFEVGDVVALKSGSLPMTVGSINAKGNDNDNFCLGLYFFDMQGNLVKVVIPQDCLEYTEKRWSIMDIDADIDDEDGEDEY